MDDHEKLKTALVEARMELAYMTLQRDALLSITWLDGPGEPIESTQQWREQFTKGWERRAMLEDAQAEIDRLRAALGSVGKGGGK